MGPQELPIRPSPGKVKQTWGGLRVPLEVSTKAVTVGNGGGGAQQSTCDPAESWLSCPGSQQGLCCLQILLPGPGDAGPCLLPSGSKKGPASLQLSMFFQVTQLTQVLAVLQAKEHSFLVILSLCMETVVTQVDRDSVPGFHPPRWCCQKERSWTLLGSGTPLPPVRDTGIYGDDHPSTAPNTSRGGVSLHGHIPRSPAVTEQLK